MGRDYCSKGQACHSREDDSSSTGHISPRQVLSREQRVLAFSNKQDIHQGRGAMFDGRREGATERTHMWAQVPMVRKLAQPKDLLRATAHSRAVLVLGLTQLTQMTQKDYTVLLNIAIRA